MAQKSISLLLLSVIALARHAYAWDNDDLEVFDVVEEVNQNFYELIGVSQEATSQEIKSAFKKLTLKLHPDKNDSPDADVQFRNLVSVHNILKDAAKREKYNDVLKNGLPNWRSAVYYYRHVRKMGLVEGSIIIFIIVTLGQYLVGWAAYVEKRYTAEQILSSRSKRQQKKNNLGMEVAEILEQFPRPSVLDTLPFQIPKWLFRSIVAIPSTIMAIHKHFKDKKEEKIRQIQKEEADRERAEREAAEAEAAKAARAAAGPRRRRGFVPTERECLLDPADEPSPDDNRTGYVEHKPVISGGLWTDDDLAELVRLVKKYPPGAAERWERIADTMSRTVQEVTHMAAKMKDNCYRLPGQEDPQAPILEPPKKVKTRKTEVPTEAQTNWTQAQQKALEAALAKVPKNASDRWDRVANAVPDKTKEECIQRCKYLTEVVRNMREKERADAAEKERENKTVTDEASENIT